MNGPITYGEASEMPLPDALHRYQVLMDRDMMSRSVADLRARGRWNADRSLDPDDYPPLTVAEHLELLALGEALARYYRHPTLVHHAVLAGATWQQIAGATGGDVHQARQGYVQWARGQRELREQFPDGTIGLSEDEYREAVKAAGTSGGQP